MKRHFDYFYGEQADQFSFYRTPKVFFTEKEFEDLSAEAKILYGLLLDRVSLSTVNGWKDDEGRIFIYCTLESIQAAMGCAHQKATKLLNELIGYGLIEKKNQGLGKPAIIYVKNFVECRKTAFLDDENHRSEMMKISIPECQKSSGNNTYINNNKYKNTNLILSEDVDKDKRKIYCDYLKEKIGLSALYNDFPSDKECISEIFEIIVDTVCSKKEKIRISGDDKPCEVVRSRFLKLGYDHIAYVLGCMKNNATSVKNIKQYILTSLYNAPMTISNYYRTLYNNNNAS